MVAVEPGAVLATMAIRWMRDLAEVDLFVVRFATERTATQWAWHGSSNAVRTEYLPAASNLRGAAADNLGMSLPRAIVPGRRYMITRRCSERRFFMRPDRETNNAFIYCLAFAARKAESASSAPAQCRTTTTKLSSTTTAGCDFLVRTDFLRRTRLAADEIQFGP
jgi:hypothetical protein